MVINIAHSEYQLARVRAKAAMWNAHETPTLLEYRSEMANEIGTFVPLVCDTICNYDL